MLNGRTLCGQSVSVACEGFHPSLRILSSDAESISLLESMNPPITGIPELLYDMKGYSPKRTSFLRYEFESCADFCIARARLRSQSAILYDCNLPPSMQMLVECGISPGEWVSIPSSTPAAFKCRSSTWFRVDWTSVTLSKDAPSTPAPFKVLSFDIECASSHGEFPLATKGFDRAARELDAWPTADLADASIVENALSRALDAPDSGACSTLSRIYSKDAGAIQPDSVRDVARRIVDSTKVSKEPRFVKSTEKVPAKRAIATSRRSRILDILNSSRGIGLVEGDPIIQIGCSLRCLGYGAEESADGSEDYVLVLKSCDEVAGASVRTFDREADMIREFFSYIRRTGADIVTGYNILGFDFKFIVERAQELGMDVESDAAFNAGLFDESVLSTVISGSTFDVAGARIVRRGVDNQYTHIEHPGRVVCDLMHSIKSSHSLASYRLDAVSQHFTGESKDDVTPAQIFASFEGSSFDRSVVAAYCIQDCRLVLHLASKLNTIPNALGMAAVCGVPTSWIFHRGQGCKALSLVARQCRADGFSMPAMSRDDVDVSYAGATVFDPDVGAYTETPVVVLDFSSLYPSSMISHNISHDTLVAISHPEAGEQITFELDVRRKGSMPSTSGTTKIVSFVGANTREGIIPRILKKLLAQRKSVKGRMKSERDEFAKQVLDGLQLAYKITANSIYGQLGAPTSPIFMPELAAATTAVGRQMLHRLRDYVVQECRGRVIYGDTDSCFMVFPDACSDSSDPRDRLARSIGAGRACSKGFRSKIPSPHDAEYEKTFFPFVLLSKKRYVGLKYTDVECEPERASMGIVLKRRDNAPIVKRIYGEAIDHVLGGDVTRAVNYVQNQLMDLAYARVGTDELVISKKLRAPEEYVDPSKIAHAVLVERMNSREPGSAPVVGERVPYVYIKAPKGTLQGNRIEHPDHLRTHGQTTIDYVHYLTNQLEKPIVQLFSALIDDIPGARETSKSRPAAIANEVHRVLFREAVAVASRSGNSTITSFFAPSK